MNHAVVVRRASLALGLVLLFVLASCSRGASRSEPASRLSADQRDSVLARSSVPGASAVGRAFEVREQEAGHAASLDSLAH